MLCHSLLPKLCVVRQAALLFQFLWMPCIARLGAWSQDYVFSPNDDDDDDHDHCNYITRMSLFQLSVNATHSLDAVSSKGSKCANTFH